MKKVIVFVLALMMVAVMASLSLGAALPAEGSDLRITLINQQPDPVAPGGQFDVRFKAENSGSANAQNVRVKLIDEYPFAVAGENERAVGSIGSQQDGDVGVIAKFTVKVMGGAADGGYKLKFAYSINSGIWVEKEISGINVKSGEAVIAVASTTLTPERIAQGSTGKLAITLKNYAASEMTNIRAELMTGATFSPIGSTNVRMIDRLESGQSAALAYSFMPAADAASKVYPTALLITYTDTLGNSLSRNETIGIPVFSKPSYDLNVEDSKAYTTGSTGDVVISISDTGASQIKYLVIELLGTNAYDLVSTSKVYVGNLESNDYQTASFKIHVKSSPAVLRAKLTYKDDYNQPYEEEVQLPLKVYTPAEAKAYGLMAGPNITSLLISITIQVLLLVFAVFMLIDLIKKPIPTYKKVLWAIIILTLLGAIIYYFIGRKKAAKQ